MAKASKSRSTSKRPPSSTALPSKPPAPSAQPQTHPSFQPPSPPLLTLLSTFPTPHTYILHLDPTTPHHRLLIYTLPLLFNTTLLLLLLYRAYIALPTYLSILQATLGYPTSHAFDFSTASVAAIARLVAERMGLFFFDGVVLGRVVAEWPLEFFLGWRLGSAFSWRCLRVGLPMAGREVVVRRSRRWGEGLAVGVNGEEGVEWWMREDGEEGGMKEVAVEKIQKAVRREWVGGKSGLLMIDKDWDLYFQGMVDAHWLLDRGKLGFGELEEGPVVAVWSGERGWLVWRPWDGDGEGDGEGKEGEGGRKLRLFKDMLTSVGKEGLFFRWVEMMQFESSRGQGGFTRERRQKVVERSRELFEEQGVSWDEAMQGIGGVDGLPGMEITG